MTKIAKNKSSEITKEEVLRLGALSRIDIPESQIERVSNDIGKILAYVESINEVGDKLGKISAGKNDKKIGGHEINDIHIVKNVLREDVNPHESGIYTEAMLSVAPAREGNFLKVKKIL